MTQNPDATHPFSLDFVALTGHQLPQHGDFAPITPKPNEIMLGETEKSLMDAAVAEAELGFQEGVSRLQCPGPGPGNRGSRSQSTRSAGEPHPSRGNGCICERRQTVGTRLSALHLGVDPFTLRHVFRRHVALRHSTSHCGRKRDISRAGSVRSIAWRGDTDRQRSSLRGTDAPFHRRTSRVVERRHRGMKSAAGFMPSISCRGAWTAILSQHQSLLFDDRDLPGFHVQW